METLPPPNLDHLAHATLIPPETSSAENKAKADSSTAAYADPNAVIVVSRTTFNYVVIAIVFFALGSVLSGLAVSGLFNANSIENQALIDKAIAGSSGTGQAVTGLVQGNVYDVSADNNPMRGAKDAPVTIIEFSDFHCAFCGRFAAETLDPLLKNYDGKVRLVYRDYPFQTDGSWVAAMAGECMNDQNKFWEFHDLTFKNQQALTREQFITYAQQLKIDVATFTTCLDSQKYLDKIKKEVVDAQNLGVNATPAFFVNGRFISGAQPYNFFASYIDAELGKLAESPITSPPVASS
ncbi:MAG: DsbA family protein [Anaerolineae bacterium]|nr:DsbA family protein [Anaerolineae bacterium]